MKLLSLDEVTWFVDTGRRAVYPVMSTTRGISNPVQGKGI